MPVKSTSFQASSSPQKWHSGYCHYTNSKVDVLEYMSREFHECLPNCCLYIACQRNGLVTGLVQQNGVACSAEKIGHLSVKRGPHSGRLTMQTWLSTIKNRACWFIVCLVCIVTLAIIDYFYSGFFATFFKKKRASSPTGSWTWDLMHRRQAC